MDFEIRKFREEDKNEVISMMETFYSSDAVSTNGSSEIFNNNFETCLQGSPYVEGFALVSNNEILGYSMIAKSFSTEFGKQCIWLEDLYLKSEYRGKGVIPKVINYIKNLYSSALLRLEVEDYNTHAVHVYEKSGFIKFPYVEMYKH